MLFEPSKSPLYLRRHFKKLIKLPGLNNQKIGEKFVNLIDEAFKNYAFFQQTQNILEFLSWASDFQSRVNSGISEWIGQAGAEAGKLLRSLQEKAHQWWYFIAHPEIPPDNNLAERTLRLAVTKRKVSGGSRSMERFQHTAHLLSRDYLSSFLTTKSLIFQKCLSMIHFHESFRIAIYFT